MLLFRLLSCTARTLNDLVCVRGLVFRHRLRAVEHVCAPDGNEVCADELRRVLALVLGEVLVMDREEGSRGSLGREGGEDHLDGLGC
jgi:hypothetical protein